MVGWHHQLNGQELEQTPGESETGKPGVLQSMGSESDMTEPLNIHHHHYLIMETEACILPTWYPKLGRETAALGRMPSVPWGSISTPGTLEGWAGPEATAQGPEPMFERRGLLIKTCFCS